MLVAVVVVQELRQFLGPVRLPTDDHASSREKGGSGPARSIPFLLLPFGSPPLKLPLSGLELIRSAPVGAVRGRGP